MSTVNRLLGALALTGVMAGVAGCGAFQKPVVEKRAYAVVESIQSVCEPTTITVKDNITIPKWNDCGDSPLNVWKRDPKVTDKSARAYNEFARGHDGKDLVVMNANPSDCRDALKVGGDVRGDGILEIPAGTYTIGERQVQNGCTPKPATYRTEQVDVVTGTHPNYASWLGYLAAGLAGLGLGYLMFGRRGRRNGERPDEEIPGRRLVPEEPADFARPVEPAVPAQAGGEPIVVRDITAGGEERVAPEVAQAARETALAIPAPAEGAAPAAPEAQPAPAEGRPEGEGPRGPDDGPQLPAGGGGRRRRGRRNDGEGGRGPAAPAGEGPQGAQGYLGDETVGTLIRSYVRGRNARLNTDIDCVGAKAQLYRAFKATEASKRTGRKESDFDGDFATYAGLDAEIVKDYGTMSAEAVAEKYAAMGVKMHASTVRRLAQKQLGEVGYKTFMAEKKSSRASFRGYAAVNDNRGTVVRLASYLRAAA